MIRTAPYRWFMHVVFAPEKVLTNTTICVQFFGYFPSIKVFYHTVSYDKYRFFVLFSFWFVIFVIICCHCFCGLQLLSNDLTIAMFLLAFLEISSSCLSFWLFSFIAETSWSVFIFAFLALHGFRVLELFVISLVFRNFYCCCLLRKKTHRHFWKDFL